MRIQVEGRKSGHEDQDEGMGDKPMLWALHAHTRNVVHIGQFDRGQTGLACQCICYSCKTPLEAVNAGREASYFLQPNARSQFFRHAHGQQKNDCLKTAARLAALHMFMRLDQIDLPPPKATGRFQGASGDVYEHTATGRRVRGTVAHKRWIDEQKALITLDDGQVILIRLVTDTSVSDDGQFDAVITIQVDDPAVASWPPEKLLQNAALVDDWFCWDRHWEHAALTDLANAQALQQAQELIDAEPDGLAMPPGLTPWQRSETLLHNVIKTMLANIGHIRVPGVSVSVVRKMPDGTVKEALATIEPTTLKLSNVRLEMHLGNQVPDVMCTATDTGPQLGTFRLLIEVAVTHRVDAIKMNKIRAAGLSCLEVDAGLIDAPRRCSKDTLNTALRYDDTNKRWVNLPAIQGRVRVTESELDAQASLMLQRLQRSAKRDKWASEQSVGEIASLYLQALRKYWSQPGPGWQAISIHHQDMDWSLSELAQVMKRKGCGPADEHIMVECYGVLWSLNAIEQAAPWPDIPFNFHAIVKRLDEARSTQPFIGLMAMAATVFGVREMEHGPRAEEVFQLARESLKRLEVTYARHDTFDRVIAAVFPVLAEALQRPGGTYAHVMRIHIAKAGELARQRVALEQESAKAQLREYEESVAAAIRDEIEKITRLGWLPANGLSRSIEQCRGYLSPRDRLPRHDVHVLVAEAHRARGMGIDLAEWIRLKNPVSVSDVRLIGALLKKAWLISFP